MKGGNFRERLGHLFAGAVIILLVEFHELAEKVTGGREALTLALLYLVSVVAMFLIEALIQSVWGLRKIKLPVAGKVDGVWLDEVREDGVRVGGSILHVKTMRPDEFHVKGETWAEDGQYKGWWEGTGVYDGESGFGFAYAGGERREGRQVKTGSGAGQYFFYQSDRGHAANVEGTFSAHGLHKPRTIEGRWYGSRIKDAEKVEILKRFLKNPAEPLH